MVFRAQNIAPLQLGVSVLNFKLNILLYFTRFALSLDKLGCTSEIKIKASFHFVFHSVCTIFAPTEIIER